MDAARKSQVVRLLTVRQGFDHVGIAPARRVQREDYVRRWLAEGKAGEMTYLQRDVHKRVDPSALLEGARSVIVVALNYHQRQPPRPDDRPRGRVAQYAWGNDYHVVIKKKLWRVIDQMREDIDETFEAKPCVDTSAIIERDFAQQAGIGWIGKNTLVLHQDLGSFFFLGVIVTTLELEYDSPAADHCGSCTRCLDACPTQAFPAAYEMDARRCISYHTIELRSDIPEEFHKPMGEWVFGCDICQEVCPYNHEAPPTSEPEFTVRAPGPHPLLSDLLRWQTADYRQTLKGSAMKRATLEMLKRNAAIAAQNIDPE